MITGGVGVPVFRKKRTWASVKLVRVVVHCVLQRHDPPVP